MTWWIRRRRAETVPELPCPENDANRALKRAQTALDQAEIDLIETRTQTGIIRRERAVNHFGPIIYEGMMRGRRDQPE